MLIKQTTLKDLDNIRALWAHKEVMHWVGFPEGYVVDEAHMLEWFHALEVSENSKHFTITDGSQYIGELHYRVCKNKTYVDIKCMPYSWKKGYGTKAFASLLTQVFQRDITTTCVVDPHIENAAAIALYVRMGFKATKLEGVHQVMELTWHDFRGLPSLMETEFVIRPLQATDLHRLWELSAKEPHYRWADYNAPYFEEYEMMTLEDFIATDGARMIQRPRYQGIFIQGQLIGTVNAYWQHEKTRWLETGIVLFDEAYWNHGIATRALRQWIQHMFDSQMLDRVGFTTWSGNPGMMQVGVKLGMTCDRCVKHARFYKNTYYDSVGYGVLRRDWDALQSTTVRVSQDQDVILIESDTHLVQITIQNACGIVVTD